jgi:hypothetical protein
MGWEIGEIESEEGGAFVVQAGDENGDSYIGFAVADLTEGVTEDAEYNDEAGMVQSNLRTMARAVNGLLDIIEDNDNLPEWAQEKLAKAEMMTTSVWDYLLSQKEQGIDPKVTEGSQRVDSLVTDALRIMKGSEVSDAVSALKTVLGDREYNGRRGHYNFYVRQILDMYGQQGVTETKKPSPKLTAVDIKKTNPVSEEINTEAYERLQKVFAFKNYES